MFCRILKAAAHRICVLLTTFVLRILGVPRFFVSSVGTTNGAHRDVVRRLKGLEVTSPQEADYILVFCPVASRVGTDVEEALNKTPGNKPTILVVMHHTFSPDHVVADSRRLVVAKAHVLLTVDTLFYEGHFLRCQRNKAAWDQVNKHLRGSLVQIILAKLWGIVAALWGLVWTCLQGIRRLLS